MRHRPHRRPGRGVSIVEALITMALIAIVLLALAPLFSQSVNVNASSSQLSVANTLAREKLEELLAYPTTDERLFVAGGSSTATFANDLPAWVNPSTGETSTAASSPGAGWYPYPYERTYTVEPFVTDPVIATPPNPLVAVTSTIPEDEDESSYNLPGAVPYYEVKLVTVTVRPTSGPFVGLRRTTQSAYARYRNATPN